MHRAWLVAVLTVALTASLPACATTDAPASTAPSPADGSGAKPSVGAAPAAARDDEAELRLSRALMDLDKRVDQFVTTSSQGGEEARQERNLLGPAIEAQVAQFGRELLTLAGDARNPDRRRIAVKALAFSDDPAAVPVLAAALTTKGDARLLTNATYALARIKSPKTPVEPLLELVRDPDPDIRSNALLALWHVFDARRAAGASALDPIATQKAMPFLETALFDPADPLIRAHAAATLGALGDPRAVDPLLNLLRDEHPLVRTQTVIALGKLGDQKAVPALVNIIDETPNGTPKQSLLLSLSVLLEGMGLTVPLTLGEDERSWERFIRESTGRAEK